MVAQPPSARKLGLWMTIALVMGNMIGSGVFLLPASLAPYGLNSIVGWVLSAAGAIALAVVLSRLSRAFPDGGGPYAYTHAAFGPLPAFLVAWGYWINVWVGNAAIATGAVTASATLTLFALLGLESATIPDGKVDNPERTIPRATMIGTVLTSVIYVMSCSTVLILLPTSQLASSNAPFADVARMFWGGTGAALVALAAAISGFGALNGWILLQGEVPYVMAKDGVFPKVFARTSRRNTPIFALVFGSALVTVLVFLNAGDTSVRVFTFMVLLATSACLVMYLVCCLALLRLRWLGRLGGARRGTAGLAAVGLFAGLYSLWAIAGAGREASLWGLVLFGLGGPVYWLMRRRPGSAPVS